MQKYLLKLAAAGSLVLSTFTAHAQVWESITANLPTAMQGAAHSMDSDGPRFYVLTQTNGVYVSADNGNSFTPINDVEGNVYSMTNKPGRFIRYVNGSIWVGWDPGSGAIAGNGPINYGAATLHRLTPGETVWHKSSSGFPVGDTGNQADDLAYDPANGTYYAASALGGAFVSKDGSNWQQRATGLGGVDLPVSIVAFDGMAFVSRGLEQVQRTTNQGTNWVALQSHQGFSTGLMLEKNKRLMFISNGPDRFNYSDDHGDTWHFTTNGVRQLGDLTAKDGLIYASGIFYGSAFEQFYGRPGFKFSATDGISWDNIPTNGLPMDSGFLTIAQVKRHGNYLFAYFNINGPINLYRLNVSGFDFRPTTQIVDQPPATNNFLVGQTLKLSVLAGGTNLTYQWSFKGTNLPGATNATYSFPQAQTNNSGTYQLVVQGDRGSVTSSVVTVIVGERADGKYDITYNNPATGGWIYLLPDGSLVSLGGPTFWRMNPTGERAVTRTISGATFQANLVDSSNYVVLAGRFTQAPRGTRLIRAYSTNLVDDPTFSLPYANGDFTTMAELPGRGYLVGGTFTMITNSTIATNTVGHVCLINYSGVVDTNFVFSEATSVINKIAVADKTNIFLSSGAINGFNFNKLNLNGSVDTNFSHTASGNNVSFFQAYTNGKLFAVVSSKAVLLNPDGTLDSTFNTANAIFNNTVTSIAVGESNNIYVVGTFTTYANKTLGKYARLFSDGTVDTNFYTVSPSTGGFTWNLYDSRGYVYVIRDTSSGSFQGQSYGTGPYRLFAGTNSAATAATGFDAWAAQFTFPPGKNNPQDDADGDGIPNVFEYYFGSNPTLGASGTKPLETTVNNGGQNYPAITFIRSKTAGGVTLIPQASTSLAFTNLLGTTVESVIDLGNGTEQVTIRSTTSVTSQQSQFLRILLSVP